MARRFLSRISPWHGVVADIQARSRFYKQDWMNGLSSGFRILTPTIYIFCAIALPVTVFGEQLYINTDGTLSAFDTLTSTAICGIFHALIGGQPLVILGIAEPTVYLYTDLYKFAKTKESLGQRLFVPWAAWICVWTSLLLIIFAVLGGSSIAKRFTRIAGETFEVLIALLFIQQAIKGMVSEFKPSSNILHVAKEASELSWRYVNGFFGLLLCFGFLFSSLKTRNAHTWRYGSGWMRGLISNYGVPLMVIVWTGLSFTFYDSMPKGVPQRLQSPNAWDVTSSRWSIIKDMGEVPTPYIFIAILPAIAIAGLLIFDHSVAAQMAEQEIFNLQAPSTHHYDMFLLGLMVLVCGFIGVPPCSGLVPQSPMHTKCLAKLNRETARRKLVQIAKKGIEDKVTLGELYGSMQEVYKESRKPSPNASVDWDQLKELTELRTFRDAEMVDAHVDEPVDVHMFDPEKDVDALLPVTVNEQRLTNLIQSILMGVIMVAMPLIKLVPVSVLWGYFFYMAFETMQGNQFCERLLLILTAPSRRYKVLEEFHATFVEIVPFHFIARFTIFQAIFLLLCFGFTWIPRVGVLFPLSVFVLVFIRQHILPRFFQAEHLQELDAAEYEEAPAIPHERALEEAGVHGLGKIESMRNSVSDSEILNDMTTRGRGEIKVSLARIEQWTNVNGQTSFRQRSKRMMGHGLDQSSRRITPTNDLYWSEMGGGGEGRISVGAERTSVGAEGRISVGAERTSVGAEGRISASGNSRIQFNLAMNPTAATTPTTTTSTQSPASILKPSSQLPASSAHPGTKDAASTSSSHEIRSASSTRIDHKVEFSPASLPRTSSSLSRSSKPPT